MSNNERRIGLRCREKLKLRSQKVCRKCKRHFFPSSYSEYSSDIEDDEICIGCNAEQKTVKQSEQPPPLPSIAHQSGTFSIPAISRKSNNNNLPAFKYIIPTAVLQKTSKTSNETASSTIANDKELALSNAHTKGDFKGTIKFERAPKRRQTASRSIKLSSLSQNSPEPDDENEDAVTNKEAISFESMPSLDPIDNFIAAFPINNNKNNRIREKKQTSTNIIPTNTNNNNSLEPITSSVAQLKKSVTNIQPDEQIFLTSIGETNTKTKSASIEPPVATRVSARIKKKLVPFGLKWSPALPSASNEHQEQNPPAKKAKIQRTDTKTQPNEENVADSDIQPVPIEQIITDSRNATPNKVDILDMIVIHSRVHPSKEKEITSSEMLSVRPMDIKDEAIVEETNPIDLDIQKDDSIDTLREKFPKASQYELEYLLFLSKGQKWT